MLLKKALLIFSIDFTNEHHFLQILCHKTEKVLISPKDCSCFLSQLSYRVIFQYMTFILQKVFFFKEKNMTRQDYIKYVLLYLGMENSFENSSDFQCQH